MNIQGIIEAIASPEIKVVSFDIFDTLLVRPCRFPYNLFRIVGRRCNFGESFERIRVEAEKVARLNRPEDHDDVTLEEIYQVMAAWNCPEFSAEKLETLKQTELQVEWDYLYRREPLAQVYHAAAEMGKTVIITSDMYLPAVFLEKVLAKNGYTDHAKIYVSCEYMLAKGSKRLFRRIIEDFSAQGIAPNEILHIGDNITADYKNSLECGMQAVHVESGISSMVKSRFYSPLAKTNLSTDNTFLVGLIANTYFDSYLTDPPTSSWSDQRLDLLTSLILSPLFFSFTKWMLEDCILRGSDSLALVYRDGYVPEKIIEMLAPLYPTRPRILRLDLSRRALVGFAKDDPAGLVNYLTNRRESANMTVANFLSLVIGITDLSEMSEVFERMKAYGYNSLDNAIGETAKQLMLVPLLEPYFKKYAQKNASVVEEYIRSIVKGSQKLALFDIGYSGRISELLRSKLSIDNYGYHMIHYSDAPKYPQLISCISIPRNTPSVHNSFLEDMISCPIPSVRRIKKADDGSFVLERAADFLANCNILSMQDTLFKDVQSYITVFNQDIAEMRFDPQEFYSVYRRFLDTPTIKDIRLFKTFSFQDDNAVSNSFYSRWYASKYEQLSKQEEPLTYAVQVFDEIFAGFASKDKRLDEIKTQFERAYSEVYRLKRKEKKPFALFLGANLSFDKGTVEYLKK